MHDSHQGSYVGYFGMWVFLATEILFFGAAFSVYFVYRFLHMEAFRIGSGHLNFNLGFINTSILLLSSVAMAFAVRALTHKNGRAVIMGLVATAALGSAFLAIKSVEYFHKFRDGLVPGPRFSYEGPRAEEVELFFSMYFSMTAIHALHMLIGILLILIYVALLLRKSRWPGSNAISGLGLYWHFVDIVWLFLYPLLYLNR